MLRIGVLLPDVFDGSGGYIGSGIKFAEYVTSLFFENDIVSIPIYYGQIQSNRNEDLINKFNVRFTGDKKMNAIVFPDLPIMKIDFLSYVFNLSIESKIPVICVGQMAYLVNLFLGGKLCSLKIDINDSLDIFQKNKKRIEISEVKLARGLKKEKTEYNLFDFSMKDENGKFKIIGIFDEKKFINKINFSKIITKIEIVS